MIEPQKYIEIVRIYFQFLVDEFKFQKVEEKLRGNVFYDVSYRRGNLQTSISFENIEDYLLVVIFILFNGHLPDFDDETKTLHLQKLMSAILPTLTKEDFLANSKHFSQFEAENDIERRLLKSAKDLRMCLKYSDQIPMKNEVSDP